MVKECAKKVWHILVMVTQRCRKEEMCESPRLEIFCTELRRHLARIRKYYPEKTCVIRGNELCFNGRVFEYSEEKKKLVRSKSAKIIEKTVSSSM